MKVECKLKIIAFSKEFCGYFDSDETQLCTNDINCKHRVK